MTERGVHTHNEILSQPEAWAEALSIVQASRADLGKFFDTEFDQVLFTGCGSTYYLSLAAANLFQELTGRMARAVPAGELLLNGGSVLTSGKTMLVAVSRSGSTTETVRAVETFKAEKRGKILGITNYGAEPLAGLADRAIVIPKGQEESVAQTRSFASMYVAAAGLALVAAGADGLLGQMEILPKIGAALIQRSDVVARQIGEDLDRDRFYFLGSGGRYGLACEVNLKMKEMTLTHSEPFHFLEFRHGPMSMVNDRAVVVGLLSEKNQRHESLVLDEMRAKGGQVLDLAENGAQVSFESGLPEALRNVLYLPALQLMAYYRSMAKGLNPDRPNNLTAVVKLDL